MKESRIKFIKRAHESACSDWKTEIENEFPKLFTKSELEVGKWYKGNDYFLFCYNGTNDCQYGFSSAGYWSTDLLNSIKPHDYFHNWTLATDKEVEKALIKEAKCRGFKKGVKVVCLNDGKARTVSNYDISRPSWEIDIKQGFNIGTSTVMMNGKWAEIIQTITKEEAEKELGKTIVG